MRLCATIVKNDALNYVIVIKPKLIWELSVSGLVLMAYVVNIIDFMNEDISS